MKKALFAGIFVCLILIGDRGITPASAQNAGAQPQATEAIEAVDSRPLFARLADRINQQEKELDSICQQQLAIARRWDRTDKQLAEIGPIRQRVKELNENVTRLQGFRDGFKVLRGDVQEMKSQRRGILDKLNQLQEGRAKVIDSKADLKDAKAALATARSYLVTAFGFCTVLAGLTVFVLVKFLI